ncbi:MAG: RNA polymerase sigma factor [Patescibacteria group bacterium]
MTQNLDISTIYFSQVHSETFLIESVEEITDEDLVHHILKGNRQSFEIIVKRYAQPLLRYLMRLMYFNQSEAEDALSETFLKAYDKLGGFNPRLKFSSWIYRIAHNQAIDALRKRKLVYVGIEEIPITVKTDFEKAVSNKIDLEKILAVLPEPERNLLCLFYLEEKSLIEIGQILKIPPKSVAVKLHRARTKAKDQIQNIQSKK